MLLIFLLLLLLLLLYCCSNIKKYIYEDNFLGATGLVVAVAVFFLVIISIFIFSLRNWWSFLETVFVGQCEVFVCLGFVEIIHFLYFFPLAAKIIGPQTGCQFFQNVDLFYNSPLNVLLLLTLLVLSVM